MKPHLSRPTSLYLTALSPLALPLGLHAQTWRIWDDGNTGAAAAGGGDADQNWSTGTNWRDLGGTTGVDNNIAPSSTAEVAAIAFDSGLNQNGTATTIAGFPGAGAGGAVNLDVNASVHAVRIGDNPGIGYGGHGRLENNGFTLTVDNTPGLGVDDFVLGDDGDRSGTYIQTAGTLELDGSNQVIVGRSNAEGYFGLSGGTVNADAAGFIIAGGNAAAEGSFVMDGGILNVAGGNFETASVGTGVAIFNAGTFNQTTNNIIIGQGTLSNALFENNGATITTQNQIRIANRGTGVYVQTAGTTNVGTILDMANQTNAGGVSVNPGNASANVSGGVLNIGTRSSTGPNGDLIVGNDNNAGATAVFTVSGGEVNVSSEVRVGQTGNASSGTFDISAGTVNVRQNFIHGVNGTADGTMTGGTLNIANALPASFVATGGGAPLTTAGSASDFLVGQNNGSVGTWTQTAGTVNVGDGGNDSDIVIGNNMGSTGIYDISGGTINVDGAGALGTSQGDIIAGNASGSVGTFNVSGTADVNLDYRLIVGQSGQGTMNMSGGTVDGRRYIVSQAGGDGTQDVANISGGTATFTDFIHVGQGAGADAVLNMSGGVLALSGTAANADNLFEIARNGTGLLNQTGGDIQADGRELRMGQTGGNATYDHTGGTSRFEMAVLRNSGGDIDLNTNAALHLIGPGGTTVTGSINIDDTLNVWDGTATAPKLVTQAGTTFDVTGDFNVGNGDPGAPGSPDGNLNILGDAMINGTGTVAGNTFIGNGAIMSGDGMITTANLTIDGGVLSPTDAATMFGIGDLEINSDLTMQGGASWLLDLDPAGVSDRVLVNGMIDLAGVSLDGGLINLTAGDIATNDDLTTGSPYWIAINDGIDPILGGFSNAVSGASTFAPASNFVGVGGQLFAIFYDADFDDFTANGFTAASLSGGNDILLIAIPEPSRAVLLGLGLGALFLRRRRS